MAEDKDCNKGPVDIRKPIIKETKIVPILTADPINNPGFNNLKPNDVFIKGSGVKGPSGPSSPTGPSGDPGQIDPGFNNTTPSGSNESTEVTTNETGTTNEESGIDPNDIDSSLIAVKEAIDTFVGRGLPGMPGYTDLVMIFVEHAFAFSVLLEEIEREYGDAITKTKEELVKLKKAKEENDKLSESDKTTKSKARRAKRKQILEEKTEELKQQLKDQADDLKEAVKLHTEEVKKTVEYYTKGPGKAALKNKFNEMKADFAKVIKGALQIPKEITAGISEFALPGSLGPVVPNYGKHAISLFLATSAVLTVIDNLLISASSVLGKAIELGLAKQVGGPISKLTDAVKPLVGNMKATAAKQKEKGASTERGANLIQAEREYKDSQRKEVAGLIRVVNKIPKSQGSINGLKFEEIEEELNEIKYCPLPLGPAAKNRITTYYRNKITILTRLGSYNGGRNSFAISELRNKEDAIIKYNDMVLEALTALEGRK